MTISYDIIIKYITDRWEQFLLKIKKCYIFIFMPEA
jgi:hypothetical protein